MTETTQGGRWLRCPFWRHAITGLRTATAEFCALFDHRIVTGDLFTALCAASAELSTEGAGPIVKR